MNFWPLFCWRVTLPAELHKHWEKHVKACVARVHKPSSNQLQVEPLLYSKFEENLQWFFNHKWNLDLEMLCNLSKSHDPTLRQNNIPIKHG